MRATRSADIIPIINCAGIFSTAIVDRGRNILCKSTVLLSVSLYESACSRDGSVRLWDCGSAAQIRTVVQHSSPINSILLVDGIASAPAIAAGLFGRQPCFTYQSYMSRTFSHLMKDSREVGTDTRTVFAATEDGLVLACDLRSQAVVPSIAPSLMLLAF